MKTDEQILKELKAASDGLLMMSESDYPFRLVRFEGPEESLPEQLRLDSALTQGTIETKSVDEFFRAATTEHEGMRAEDIKTVDRYRKLVEVLKENLSGLKVYKVGTVRRAVYLIGRSQAGSLLGLSTQVVET